MDRTEDVTEFLDRLEAGAGIAPLSEAKRMRLATHADESVVVSEGDEIVAVAVQAPHRQPDGSIHWAIELAVRPDMQFPEFERAILERSLERIPARAPTSVWASRSSLEASLDALGFTARRTLAYMTVPLPLAAAAQHADIRSAGPGDEEDIITVNGDAFASHREAASLDREEFDAIAAEPWFELDGILVADGEAGIEGFCWTKVHPDGDGEIYRIGVASRAQGRGLGRRLVLAGFHHLAEKAQVRRGTLWVDTANRAAVGLYESIGMSTERVNTEFERR